jgi:glutamate decarboxylase
VALWHVAYQVIGQYYQLLRLGKAGYKAIFDNLTAISDYVADEVLKIGDGMFELLSETKGKGLPLVAWRIKTDKPYDGSSFLVFFLSIWSWRFFAEFAIASHLRQRGWIVPAYTMAPHTDVRL